MYARGLDAEEAQSLIVNGFCKEVLQKLPMEFAVEAQKLVSIVWKEVLDSMLEIKNLNVTVKEKQILKNLNLKLERVKCMP